MDTINFRQDSTYKAKTVPQIVTVPDMLFATIEGEGLPGKIGEQETPFQHAVQVLYSIVYTIKFWDKKHSAPAGYAKFTVTPLEGLWWIHDGADFTMAQPDDWRWKLMLRLPDFVTPQFFKEIVDELSVKKPMDEYGKVRLEHFCEGESVQIMHIGPYNEERQDIEKMLDFARRSGYQPAGKHHELYFGDPRRTDPLKLKTILRCAVRKTNATI